MTAWLDPVGDAELIESVWADAADIETETLRILLGAAQTACEAYAYPLVVGAPIPASHKLALLFQARHTWASFQGSNRQEFGADGMAIDTNTWSLVLQARDLLRPKRSPFTQVAGAGYRTRTPAPAIDLAPVWAAINELDARVPIHLDADGVPYFGEAS